MCIWYFTYACGYRKVHYLYVNFEQNTHCKIPVENDEHFYSTVLSSNGDFQYRGGKAFCELDEVQERRPKGEVVTMISDMSDVQTQSGAS